MRIVHLSDIHLCRPWRAGTLRGKRIAGGLNWLLKRQWLHDPAAWTRTVEALVADPPDVLACTGDLCQLGSAPELAAAAAGLDRIADAGATVLYVPGNHDHYLAGDPEADRLRGALCTRYGGADPVPGLRIHRVGAVEFVLLDQATPQSLTRSAGRMTPAQWKELERLSAEPALGAGGLDPIRIVLGHYPVVRPDGAPLGPQRGLEDAAQLVHLLDALRARLYLCGHLHTAYEQPLRGGGQQLVAGSLTHRRTRFEIRIEAGTVTWALAAGAPNAGTSA
ncbi:MAG: metallophosphoesterase family protein [Planctomycetota bacterium]